MTEEGGEVKVNDFSGRPVRMADLVAAFSPERMSTYQAAAAGNHDKAAQLYVWNVKVSAAFYGPLQAVEVALRNAMHRELSRCYGLHWYDEPRTGLDGPRLSRKAAHAPLDYLRTLRNRIAHHEPIFNRHLAKDHERILEVAGWLSPPIRTWIERHSRLPALLEDPQDDPDVCF